MKYYLMSVIVRDDGIGDNGTEEYLSKETLKETFEIAQAAGIDFKVVSLMECAGDKVTVINDQAEDKFISDIVNKHGGRFGLSCMIIQLREVFQ